jgi:hypothetical protein
MQLKEIVERNGIWRVIQDDADQRSAQHTTIHDYEWSQKYVRLKFTTALPNTIYNLVFPNAPVFRWQFVNNEIHRP